MNHTPEVPADPATMVLGPAEPPSTFGMLPFGNEPAEDGGTRISTRTWAAVAAVALLVAVLAGGAAAALWRQNAGLSQQVVDMQSQVRDVTEQIDALTSDAEAVDGTADDLASRVAVLEQATQQLSQLEGLAQRLGAVEASTQELANRPEVVPEVSAADLSALQAQIDALGARVSNLQSQVQLLCSVAGHNEGAVC